MKRVFLALFLITACVLSQAVICFSEENACVSYQMEIDIFENEQAAHIKTLVTYQNQTGEALENLFFALPANSFKRESTLPYDNDTLTKAFPYGYAPGGCEMKHIRVNGRNVHWAVSGENEIYIRVPVSVETGQICEIEFDYTLLYTQNHAFLGVSDADLRLSGFYPSLLVYEDGDFAQNALTRTGKSHYSPIASFDISLSLPMDYDVACAGNTEETIVGARKYVSIHLENAREMVLVVSRKFHMRLKTTASGVSLKAYGQKRTDLSRSIAYLEEAVSFLENNLAPFPYSSFTLVFSDLAGENLTASGISVLPKGDFERAQIYKAVLKQYFADRVHPNPAMEAWLTDGLTEYLSMVMIRETQGEKAFLNLLNTRVLPALQITIPGGLTPVSETVRFQTISEYETVVCLRSAAALHEVETAMGEEAFWSGVNQYYNDNTFKTPVSDDFARAFERATGRNWADAIYHWLYTISDYAGENLYEYD